MPAPFNRKSFYPVLEAFTRLTGLSVSWKNPEGNPPSPDLPVELHDHRHPFCREIKKSFMPECTACYERRALLSDRSRDDGPFIHRCHAGARQWIVPLWHGQDYLGAWCFGPFRHGKDRPLLMAPGGSFGKLPSRTPDAFEGLAPLASYLAFTLCQSDDLIHLASISKGCGDPRIQGCLDTMRAKLGEKIRVADLARLAGLSPSRFLHRFKECTGESYTHVLSRLRLSEACRLLVHTELSVLEISSQVGFSEQSHFGVRFRRHAGLSALQYRKRMRAAGV